MKFKRLKYIRKFFAIENEEDYEYVREELEDRFSNIPNTVYNLMDIAYIKSKAKLLNIEEIKEKNEDIIFIFEGRERTDKRIFKVLLEEYKDDILIEFGDKPTILYRVKDKKRRCFIYF